MAFEAHGVVYLEVDDAISAHVAALGCQEWLGRRCMIRENELLSALARPQQWAAYRGADFVLQAAVLAHGVAEAQGFHEGNKRTATLLLEMFLHANGYELTATDDELADWLIACAPDPDTGERGISADDLAELLRPHVHSILAME